MFSLVSVTRYHYSLVNWACFFCLLPFVAPMPIGSDVQYPVFILCAVIILLDVYRGTFTITRFELYFLCISLLSFVYISPFLEYDYSIFKRVGLLFSFMMFYVFSRYSFLVKGKWVLSAIYVNFAGVIAQLLAPGLFSLLVGRITRVIKTVDLEGARGLSGFAPESGFLGAMSVVFILVSYLMYMSGKMHKINFLVVTFISIVMAFLSSSGTASLMMMALFVLFIFFGKLSIHTKLFILTLGVMLVYAYLTSNTISGRGVNIMRNILEDPYSVFVLDRSVAFRAVAISVGIESLLGGNVFGHGVGTLAYVSGSILDGTSLGNLYSAVSNRSGGLLSAFAQYTVELGIFFIILIIWLYGRVIKSRSFYIIRIMSLFFLIATFSILFPPLWLLLAMTDRRNQHIYFIK